MIVSIPIAPDRVLRSEMRECTRAEAPVAAVLESDIGMKTFRFHNGLLWEAQTTAAAANRQSDILRGDVTRFTFEAFDKHPLTPRAALIDAESLSKLEAASMHEAAARRIAERCLVVDGMIHRRSCGPLLLICRRGRDEKLTAKWTSLLSWEARRAPYGLVAARSTAHALQLASQANGTALQPYGTAPAIRIREALPLACDDLALEGAGWFAARTECALEPGTMDAVAAIAGLREALSSGMPDPIPFLDCISHADAIWPHDPCVTEPAADTDLVASRLGALLDTGILTGDSAIAAGHALARFKEAAHMPIEDEEALSDLGFAGAAP